MGKEFGQRLKFLRDREKLTLGKISEQTGLEKRFLQKLESGEKDPTTEAVRQLARLFKVREDYFSERTKQALDFSDFRYFEPVEEEDGEEAREPGAAGRAAGAGRGAATGPVGAPGRPGGPAAGNALRKRDFIAGEETEAEFLPDDSGITLRDDVKQRSPDLFDVSPFAGEEQAVYDVPAPVRAPAGRVASEAPKQPQGPPSLPSAPRAPGASIVAPVPTPPGKTAPPSPPSSASREHVSALGPAPSMAPAPAFTVPSAGPNAGAAGAAPGLADAAAAEILAHVRALADLLSRKGFFSPEELQSALARARAAAPPSRPGRA